MVDSDTPDGAAGTGPRTPSGDHAVGRPALTPGPASLAPPDAGTAPTLPIGDAAATLPFAAEDAASGASDVGAGAHLGRYQIRRVVGTGGMGLVLAAHDAELGRDVAIKLLAREHGEARSRLVREAQAMARLSHPNVVTVHEVLRVGDRAGIVMELIDGQDLAGWCATPRSWREIVGVYVQAARGLAAAHRAGMVHRDFKPSNALIDRDGVVRVTDFGLVRTTGSDDLAAGGAPGGAAGGAPGGGSIDLDLTLTRTGELLGTPAYMAPEQHRGEPTDARTDQWALACSLYGALYGHRPYAGVTYAELSTSVLAGVIRAEPADTRVPRAIRAAIRRGLAQRPADRFRTMDDLIAALTPPRRGWQVAAIGGVGIAAAAIAVVALRGGDAERCTGLDAPAVRVWNPDRASELHARFAASGLSYAPVAADRAGAGLDRYRAAWIGARTAACTRARSGEGSPELLDRRMRCLDQRLVEMSTVIDGLVGADRDTVRNAGDAVDKMRAVADCEDPVDTVPRPTAAAAQAELVTGEAELARAAALRELAQFERARPLAEHAVEIGERVGWPPLVAHALLVRAMCESRMQDSAASLATLDRAASVAAQARDDATIAEALVARVYELGDPLGKPAEALASRSFVEVALERAGQPRPLRALWLHNLAIVLLDLDRYDDAFAAEAEAVAIWRAIMPSGHYRLLDSLETLGNIQIYRGQYDQASALLHEMLDGQIATHGPDHPEVAGALGNLGVLEAQRGDSAAALEFWDRELQIQRAAGVAPRWASLMNVGVARHDLGRWSASLDDMTAALAAAEATAPGETRPVGHTATALGWIVTTLGDLDRGRDLLQRGLEAARASGSSGLDDAVGGLALNAIARGDLATARTLVADAAARKVTGSSRIELAAAGLAQRARDWTAARAAYDRAMAAAKQEPSEDSITDATIGIAECQLAQGAAAEAVEPLAARVAWLEAGGADPGAAAAPRFALARALVASGGDRARARALAETARAGFATLGAPGARRATEVERWLARL